MLDSFKTTPLKSFLEVTCRYGPAFWVWKWMATRHGMWYVETERTTWLKMLSRNVTAYHHGISSQVYIVFNHFGIWIIQCFRGPISTWLLLSNRNDALRSGMNWIIGRFDWDSAPYPSGVYNKGAFERVRSSEKVDSSQMLLLDNWKHFHMKRQGLLFILCICVWTWQWWRWWRWWWWWWWWSWS